MSSGTRLFPQKKVSSVGVVLQSGRGVSVGPILNAMKLKALLLSDGNSTRNWKALDLSNSSIRKIELSLGEVAALDFECLKHLDLGGNLLVSLDGHSLPFPHLQTLRASNCRISTVTNFGSHFRLLQLDISGNHITDIIGLSNTPLRFTLRELNLARNQISEFKGLAPLSTFESLETLDLRQNPLCNFGNVAEGFALICCTSLRQLNGHTVSPTVRKAVDSWAVGEACGRATVATVEAFREILQYPQGASVFCSTSRSLLVGRLNKVRSVGAVSKLPYTRTADSTANSDADCVDAVNRKDHVPSKEECRCVHSHSRLHTELNKEFRMVMKLSLSSSVQTTADELQGRPVGIACSLSDAQIGSRACATQQSEETTEEAQACSVRDCSQRKCQCDDLSDTRDGAPLLAHHKEDLIKTTSPGRNCACADAFRSCIGQETPVGCIRPLELPRNSTSS